MRRPLRIVATLQEAMWVLGTIPHYLVFVVSKGEEEPLLLSS